MAKLTFPPGTGPTNQPPPAILPYEQFELLMIAITSCALRRSFPHTKKDGKEVAYKPHLMHGWGLGMDVPIFANMVNFVYLSYNKENTTQNSFNWTPEQEDKLRRRAKESNVDTSTIDRFLKQLPRIDYHWFGVSTRIVPATCKEAVAHALRMAINGIPEYARTLRMSAEEFTIRQDSMQIYCDRWYTPLFQHATTAVPFSKDFFSGTFKFLVDKIYQSNNMWVLQVPPSTRQEIPIPQEAEADTKFVATKAFPIGTGPTFRHLRSPSPPAVQQSMLFLTAAHCALDILDHLAAHPESDMEVTVANLNPQFHGLCLGVDLTIFREMVRFLVMCYNKQTKQLNWIEQDVITLNRRLANLPGMFPIHHDSTPHAFLVQALFIDKMDRATNNRRVLTPDEAMELFLYSIRMAINVLPHYAAHNDLSVQEVLGDAISLGLYCEEWFAPIFSAITLPTDDGSTPTPEFFGKTISLITQSMIVPEYLDTDEGFDYDGPP